MQTFFLQIALVWHYVVHSNPHHDVGWYRLSYFGLLQTTKECVSEGSIWAGTMLCVILHKDADTIHIVPVLFTSYCHTYVTHMSGDRGNI